METSPALNASLSYLDHVRSKPAHFDAYCHHLACNVSGWLSRNGIRHNMLWMRLDPHADFDTHLKPSTIIRSWRFHCVIEIDGLVHDPWFPEVLPRAEYLGRMFPGQQVTCFSGLWTMSQVEDQSRDPTYAA